MFREERMKIVVLELIAVLMPIVAFADGAVKISWNANTENDLGGYRVYYGNNSGSYPVGVSAGNVTTYTINNLTSGATYYFVLTAYDNSGNESGYSQEVFATIPGNATPPSADTTAPRIVSVSINSPTQVIVLFSESVTSASAREKGNYRISDGVRVTNAALASNGVEVTLTTSAHQEDREYSVTISNVLDRSAAGNSIIANSQETYSLAGDIDEAETANQRQPRGFVLQQNFPNPFNPRTEIGYSMDKDARVVINIYNALGQNVRTLFDGQQSAGQHKVIWDARNNDGELMPSGMYLYTLDVKEELGAGSVAMIASLSRQSRTMTLLK